MTQILPKAFAITFTHTLIGTPSVGKTQILLACYRSWAEKKRKRKQKTQKLLTVAVSFCCFFLRHTHSNPTPPHRNIPSPNVDVITLP